MPDPTLPTLPELRAVLAGALMQFAGAWGSGDLVRDLIARLEDRRITERVVLLSSIRRTRRATDALHAAWSPLSVGREAEGLVESAIDQIQVVTAMLDAAMSHTTPALELQRREAAYAEVLERARKAGARD